MVLEVAETEPCGGVAAVPGRFGPVGVVGDDLFDSDTSGLPELVGTSFSRSAVRILCVLAVGLETGCAPTLGRRVLLVPGAMGTGGPGALGLNYPFPPSHRRGRPPGYFHCHSFLRWLLSCAREDGPRL